MKAGRKKGNSSGYEEFYLLRYNFMQSVESEPVFQRYMSPYLQGQRISVGGLSTDYMALYPRR
jgi:hypothetical protein